MSEEFYCKVWQSQMETLACCEECTFLETEIVGGKNPRDKDQLQRFCGHRLMSDIRKVEVWDNHSHEWRETKW